MSDEYFLYFDGRFGGLGDFETRLCSDVLDASVRGAVDADRGRIGNLICPGLRTIGLSSTAIFLGGALFFRKRNKDGDCTAGFL